MTAATKTPATHASLEAALQAVRKDLGGIEKDGTAPEMLGSFKFVSWDALAPKVGDAMAKHDVFILPEVLDAVTVEAGQTARGKTNYRTTVRLRFEVIGGGHSKQILWFGQGDDTGDKSLQKAVTSGYKYFLLKLFLASGAEDSDGQSEEMADVSSEANRRADEAAAAVNDVFPGSVRKGTEAAKPAGGPPVRKREAQPDPDAHPDADEPTRVTPDEVPFG